MANSGANSGSGIYPADMWVFPQPERVTGDLISKSSSRSGPFTTAVTIAALLLVLGIGGFVFRAAGDGFSDYGPWGYYMAVFSFIFMVTGAAPLAAVAFRFTKSHWRRPLSRVSEMFALVGVLNVLLFIPMLLVLPSIANPDFIAGMEGQLAARRSIWLGTSGVPYGAPLWWDFLGVLSLAVTSLAILWLSALPDLAQARSGSTGFRRTFYGWLAGHWYGTKRQWTHQKAGLAMLGAFYFMMLVFVQFLMVSDFAMSLIPGWKDSILPPLYTVMSFQTSLGLILVVLYVLKRWGGYQEYIGVSVFWSASKILLGLTLLWTYHLFAFFLTFWYGRLEVEQNLIKYLLFESYAGVFWANVIFSFFVPFFILLWNPVRKSALGPALAGLSILAGAFLFSIRIFVGSFNAGDIYTLGLSRVPPPVFPDIWDYFIVVGMLGGAVLVYLLGSRLIPLLSGWEVKEGARYQHMDTLFRGRYMVLAKPE